MISIVIAAYNEEKRIGVSLQKIAAHFAKSGEAYEVIVVDDGSADRTSDVVQSLSSEMPCIKVIRYSVNRGKGYALRQGVMAAAGDVILLTDADLSTPIEELSRLLPEITDHGYGIVIGSRALEASEIIRKQPWWRQGMGKIFNKLVKFIALKEFDDTQCGFKIFSGNIAKTLFKDAIIDRFAFDVEILMRARMLGFRVLEAPVKWVNSPGSKVNPVSDSMRMLYDLLKIRWSLGRTGKIQPPEIIRNYNSTK